VILVHLAGEAIFCYTGSTFIHLVVDLTTASTKASSPHSAI